MSVIGERSREVTRLLIITVRCQFAKKKEARSKRFGLNAEGDRRLERATL